MFIPNLRKPHPLCKAPEDAIAPLFAPEGIFQKKQGPGTREAPTLIHSLVKEDFATVLKAGVRQKISD